MNADQEDPLVQGHYEFKGEENYKPTASFLQKVYLILDVQLSISLILHLILGRFVTQIVAKIPFTASFIVFIPEFSFLVIFIAQLYLSPKIKSSPVKSAVTLSIRALIFYWLIRILLPAYIGIQITLFISLVLSVHFALTIYAYSMKESYNWKTALLVVGIWAILAAGSLSILNGFIVKGLFTNFAIVFCVSFVSVYGLYLVYQTGFILDGPFYAINHHQCMFAAFILQFDVIGLAFWLVQKCKKPSGNRRRN